MLHPFGSQCHLAFAIHLDIAVAHHTLERLRHRWRRDPKLFRQPRADDDIAFHAHVIDRFEVLLDYFRRLRVMRNRFAHALSLLPVSLMIAVLSHIPRDEPTSGSYGGALSQPVL